MNSFSNFNIKVSTQGFEGDKIKMPRILNREIEVHQFEISDSKCFQDKGTGKCLKLQLIFNNEKRIIFTSGSKLIEQITQVPTDSFPFKTTIIKDNDRLIFS